MTGISDDPDLDGDDASDTESVALPTRLADRVDERVAITEFDSRSEYVAYVLEHVLARVEPRDDGDREALDADDVEARLESLGYLN